MKSVVIIKLKLMRICFFKSLLSLFSLTHFASFYICFLVLFHLQYYELKSLNKDDMPQQHKSKFFVPPVGKLFKMQF